MNDGLQHPCIECAHYIKPSLLTRIFSNSMFIERCGHPLSRDRIDGRPTPCVTVRIMDCTGRTDSRFVSGTKV